MLLSKPVQLGYVFNKLWLSVFIQTSSNDNGLTFGPARFDSTALFACTNTENLCSLRFA